METISFDHLTGRSENHLEKLGRHLMHPLVVKAWREMQSKALKDEGIELKLVSSFRNFERQQIIWNEKASGKRKILNDEGIEIDISKLEETEIAAAILRFSALPGASRHHWGTDIDVYDAKIKTKEEVQLTVEESLSEFSKLNKWLDSHMEEFGFYRPYSQDRGGVSQEPWHLSYFPVSNLYFEQYTFDIFKENIQRSQINLKDLVLSDLKNIFEKYVVNIEIR